MCYIIFSVFGAAISIAHGDHNGGAVDNRAGVRHVAYLGSYYATKSPLAIVLVTRRLSQDPLRQYMGRILTRDDHALFPMESDATVMVELVQWPRKVIKPICV